MIVQGISRCPPCLVSSVITTVHYYGTFVLINETNLAQISLASNPTIFFFLSQDPIQDTTFNLLIKSPKAPLGCDGSQTLLGFDNLESFGESGTL